MRAGLDQNDPRSTRIDAAKIRTQSLPRHLRHRAHHLHAGRAAANHNEGEKLSPLGLAIGDFRARTP